MSKKNVKLGPKANVSLDGRFTLKVNRNPQKFSMTNINSFVPKGKTHQQRMKFMTSNGEVDSLFITKILTTFDPQENEIDKHNVTTLIQHYDVKVIGMTDKEWAELVSLGIKKANPTFTLTNIDRVQTVEFDKEVELIAARGILYSKSDPLSLERLKFLCGALGIPYRSKTTDTKRYRIELIKKLDKYIQNETLNHQNKSNLERFVTFVEDVQKTEYLYYISELKALEIITDIGGIWKIGIKPIGPDDDSLIDYYSKNPDIFIEHKKLVIEKTSTTSLV